MPSGEQEDWQGQHLAAATIGKPTNRNVDRGLDNLKKAKFDWDTRSEPSQLLSYGSGLLCPGWIGCTVPNDHDANVRRE